MRKTEKGQFCSVSILAVLVFAISIWAFIQGFTGTQASDITQHSMTGKQTKQDGNKKTENGKIDTKALVEEVLGKVSFDTKLSLMEDTVADSMITTASEETKIELYMGDGICADELLVLSASDKESAKAEIENVQKHLSDMQQSFQDYLPKEAKKIDNVIILQKQNYIVACVTSDADQAKKVIENQLK